MSRNDKYGINMKEWCKEHEEAVKAAVEEGTVTQQMLDDHREKITWLQHERLVHLIVTIMVVFVEVFVTGAMLMTQDGAAIWVLLVLNAAMLGLAVLLAFYFLHYFFLENAVQRWYKIAEEMKKQLD